MEVMTKLEPVIVEYAISFIAEKECMKPQVCFMHSFSAIKLIAYSTITSSSLVITSILVIS